MKTLIISFLLLISLSASSQLYYGGSTGISFKNTYDLNNKYSRKVIINDLYLSVPVGYIFQNEDKPYGFLLEGQIQGTASLYWTLFAHGGFKYDFSEHTGIHILMGIGDDLYFTFKKFQVIEKFNPTGTFRFWHNNFMIQITTIKPYNQPATYYAGIGVIGLSNN